MKTKRILSTCSLILLNMCFTSMIKGQVVISYAMDEPGFTLLDKDVNKFETIDSSYLNLVYKFRFKTSESDKNFSGEDDMDLLIGKKYIDYFSKNLHELDEKCTSLKNKQLNLPVAESSWQGYEILNDLTNKTITINNRVPYSNDICQYSEKKPIMKWELLNERDTIMGYFCNKAKTTFGGRTWVAWYNADIPLPYGPWKFGGLPGLILKITDTENNFNFECISMNQKATPIVHYKWKYKKISKKEWSKFEYNMYQHAGKFVHSIGVRVIIMDDSEKGYHRLEDTWKAFYNPIEKIIWK